VLILGEAPRRVSAPEAAKLYEETEESRAARERHAEERRLARQAGGEGGRPTKRDRRQMTKLRGTRP
jgi:ribosome-associated heat shock protein Hsp15